MRQMAVDSRCSRQPRLRRQRCCATRHALIYSLAVSRSRLCCIDKCVITLAHARSFIKRLQGGLCGRRVAVSASTPDPVAFSRTTTNKIRHITKASRKSWDWFCCSQWSCWLCLGRPPTPSCPPHRWLGGSTAGKLHWWLREMEHDPVNMRHYTILNYKSQ